MKKIIHLSDLHFRNNWEEDQDLVLDAFFKDLSKQIAHESPTDIILAFSGDLVQAGGDPNLYFNFSKKFDAALNNLGIPIAQRICVPGNHDVSVKYIGDNSIEHEGVVSQKLKEWEFNEYISRPGNLLVEKFENYLAFESQFARFGISNGFITGNGWLLEDEVGVYVLNSALCSSGGHKNINDEGRLCIDTRNLQKWLSECKAGTKILIMHHPLEWLTDWAKEQLTNTLRNHFSLCLSGHIHSQSYHHIINKDYQLVYCSAPPLLTDKRGELGYAIITVSSNGVNDIQYRQWTRRNTFVSGVNFSDTDDGKIIIQALEKVEKEADLNPKISKEANDFVGRILSFRLTEALKSFSTQPLVWVEPVLSKTNKISRNIDANEDTTVSVSELISNPTPTIIKAPPQFGLTCLALHLVKEAWCKYSSLWIYLDAKQVEWHSINKFINSELNILNLESKDIKCIILDSWTNSDKDSIKLLNKLNNLFKDTPLIIMQTIDDNQFMKEAENIDLDRDFNILHLLALPRGHIRKVVSAYNDEKHIGEEDAVITKVVSDLEALNLHRTPLNCLTLLKVSEKYFDESPVNRAEMIKMVLFLLFNMDGIPTYKAKPDLKDCEYVLGRFCEAMLKNHNYTFTREHFIKELTSFCHERVIDLEVEVVFDVLFLNNIIIRRDNKYSFRFSYWIYYFAAQRMQQEQSFANYIFEDKRYISYPEIIEFYTGIDRSREDALRILIQDLKSTADIVHDKVGIPDGKNPYRLINWQPNDKSLEKMKSEISEDVINSNLPEGIKDQYADQNYDQIKPYNQSIQKIFQEYSLVTLMQVIIASSRALRNSDYVNPEVKRELLKEITRSWEQVSKVVLALSPAMAIEGRAAFDGAGFFLSGNFGQSIEERIYNIWECIPYNIMDWFGRDLYSNKMGPLLYEQIEKEENELKRHEMALLIAHERPRQWSVQLQNYIASISKNSFFLYDIYSTLRSQYKYAFVSKKTLNDIEYLIKMCIAKHELGGIRPGVSAIKKVPNSALPDREVNNDDTQK